MTKRQKTNQEIIQGEIEYLEFLKKFVHNPEFWSKTTRKFPFYNVHAKSSTHHTFMDKKYAHIRKDLFVYRGATTRYYILGFTSMKDFDWKIAQLIEERKKQIDAIGEEWALGHDNDIAFPEGQYDADYGDEIPESPDDMNYGDDFD